jgi:hypothetical protein
LHQQFSMLYLIFSIPAWGGIDILLYRHPKWGSRRLPLAQSLWLISRVCGRAWTLGFLKPRPVLVCLCSTDGVFEAMAPRRQRPGGLWGVSLWSLWEVALTGQEPSIWRIRWTLSTLSILGAHGCVIAGQFCRGVTTCGLQRLPNKTREPCSNHSLSSGVQSRNSVWICFSTLSVFIVRGKGAWRHRGRSWA